MDNPVLNFLLHVIMWEGLSLAALILTALWIGFILLVIDETIGLGKPKPAPKKQDDLYL